MDGDRPSRRSLQAQLTECTLIFFFGHHLEAVIVQAKDVHWAQRYQLAGSLSV
jgi:hypothetical protein